MPVLDLTETPEYIHAMQPVVEAFRTRLEEMGYDPDEEWDLCQWLAWHWLKDSTPPMFILPRLDRLI